MCRYEGYDPKSEAELKSKIASVLYKDMIKADEGMRLGALGRVCSVGVARGALHVGLVFKIPSRYSPVAGACARRVR